MIASRLNANWPSRMEAVSVPATASSNSTKRISEVARAVGVSTHALRYYEREGLIDPVDRAESGHRRFSDEDLSWIEFLTCLRAAGMPMRLLREYAELRRAGHDTQERRMALIEEHRVVILQRLRDLEQHLALIEEPRASAEPVDVRPSQEALTAFGELTLGSGS
jgi:DNA-binding transcriptional MerR regulator